MRYNKSMFIVGLLSWWYGAGWRGRARGFRDTLAAAMDYFSIDLLLKTLFSPFRQISAGNVQGSLNVQMHAFFDQLISRAIGGVMRTVMILVGVVALVAYTVIGSILLLLWPIVPLAPIVGIVLAGIGWTPWIN